MSFDNLAFGHVFNAELIAGQQSSEGKLVLYKQFDEGRNDYDGSFTVAAIKAFVDEKSYATVIEFDDRAIEKVF